MTLCCLALALLAAGKEVSRENLESMAKVVGIAISREEVDTLLLLFHVLQCRHAVPDSRPPHPAEWEMAVRSLQEKLGLLDERLAHVERTLGGDRARETAAAVTPGRAGPSEPSPVPAAGKGVAAAGGVGTVENPSCGGASGPVVSVPEAEPAGRDRPGRYLYGVVAVGGEGFLTCTGVEGEQVYLVARDGLGAVVHACAAEPYVSEDTELVRSWVEAHNRVLEACMENFAAVVPYTFNTILHDPAVSDPDQVVREWLGREDATLRPLVEKLRGKAEYGVQILWEPRVIARQVSGSDPDIVALEKEIEAKPAGAAYMYKEKLSRLIKEKVEALAAEEAGGLMGQLRERCCDLKVEKNKKPEGEMQMIANWSCLARPDQAEAIGQVLEEVAARAGYHVRFTGPWPPYSFVV